MSIPRARGDGTVVALRAEVSAKRIPRARGDGPVFFNAFFQVLYVFPAHAGMDLLASPDGYGKAAQRLGEVFAAYDAEDKAPAMLRKVFVETRSRLGYADALAAF